MMVRPQCLRRQLVAASPQSCDSDVGTRDVAPRLRGASQSRHAGPQDPPFWLGQRYSKPTLCGSRCGQEHLQLAARCVALIPDCGVADDVGQTHCAEPHRDADMNCPCRRLRDPPCLRNRGTHARRAHEVSRYPCFQTRTNSRPRRRSSQGTLLATAASARSHPSRRLGSQQPRAVIQPRRHALCSPVALSVRPATEPQLEVPGQT